MIRDAEAEKVVEEEEEEKKEVMDRPKGRRKEEVCICRPIILGFLASVHRGQALYVGFQRSMT